MMMKFTNYIFKLSYTRVSNNSVNYVNTFVLRALKKHRKSVHKNYE